MKCLKRKLKTLNKKKNREIELEQENEKFREEIENINQENEHLRMTINKLNSLLEKLKNDKNGEKSFNEGKIFI